MSDPSDEMIEEGLRQEVARMDKERDK